MFTFHNRNVNPFDKQIGMITENGVFVPYGTKTKDKIVCRVWAPKWMIEGFQNDMVATNVTVDVQKQNGRFSPKIKGEMVANEWTMKIVPFSNKGYVEEVWSRPDGSTKNTTHWAENWGENAENAPDIVRNWDGFTQFWIDVQKWIEERKDWEKEKSRKKRMQVVADWYTKTKAVQNTEEINVSKWISFEGDMVKTTKAFAVRFYGERFKVYDKITKETFDYVEQNKVETNFIGKIADVFDIAIIEESAPYKKFWECTWEDENKRGRVFTGTERIEYWTKTQTYQYKAKITGFEEYGVIDHIRTKEVRIEMVK